MEKLIYLILNTKNDLDNNYYINTILHNKINYVLVEIKKTEKS